MTAKELLNMDKMQTWFYFYSMRSLLFLSVYCFGMSTAIKEWARDQSIDYYEKSMTNSPAHHISQIVTALKPHEESE